MPTLICSCSDNGNEEVLQWARCREDISNMRCLNRCLYGELVNLLAKNSTCRSGSKEGIVFYFAFRSLGHIAIR